jgi:hypothetical protein
MKNGQSFRASKIVPQTFKIQGSVLCLQIDPCARKNQFLQLERGWRRAGAQTPESRAVRLDLIGGYFQYFAEKSTEKQPKWAYLSS